MRLFSLDAESTDDLALSLRCRPNEQQDLEEEEVGIQQRCFTLGYGISSCLAKVWGRGIQW